jgi:hypothetical protein
MLRSPLSTIVSATVCGLACLLFAAGCPEAATTLEDFDGQGADVAATPRGEPAVADTPAAPPAGAPAAAAVPIASAPPASATVRPSAPMLFTYGAGNHINLVDDGVFALANPSRLDGDYLRNEVAPTNFIPAIDGFARWLDNPIEFAVDRAGALVVLIGDGILVFNNAETADGNLITDRRLDTSRHVEWITPNAMLMDRERDRLFVSTGEVIFVFDQFSKIPGGQVTPTRIIESIDFDGVAPLSLAFGPNGDLYAAANGAVLVFTDPANRSGRTLADRIIQVESPGFSLLSDAIRPEALFVDQQDRLYVILEETLYVIDRAATRDGVTLVDRKITLDSRQSLQALVIDSAGVGYLLDNSATINVVENIGARDGTVTPERSIRRLGSRGLYLWE